MTNLTYNPGSSFSITSLPSASRISPITGELLGHQGIDYGRASGVSSISVFVRGGDGDDIAIGGAVNDAVFEMRMVG